MRLGKFFFIRHKSKPSFLLEVKDGSTDEGMFITVSEPELLSRRETVDHQLWYFDRVSHTVRTKLTDFCLQMNGMHNVTYCCWPSSVFAVFVQGTDLERTWCNISVEHRHIYSTSCCSLTCENDAACFR